MAAQTNFLYCLVEYAYKYKYQVRNHTTATITSTQYTPETPAVRY